MPDFAELTRNLIILTAILAGACSQTNFQSILYNLDYKPANETSLLSVDVNTGSIPHDDQGRPFNDYRMDLYEFPNNPVDNVKKLPGSLPLVNVSWYQAKEYCQSYGKRLCSIYEWREACFSNGAGKRKTETDTSWEYPYDGIYNTDICVTETSSAAKSGSRPGCVTTSLGEKISDMSGNVWEWVDHDFYGQADQFEGQQAIVGGYYFSGSAAKCGLTILVQSTIQNGHIGFRCCRDKDSTN